MQDKVEGYKSVLLMKHSLFVVFTIIVISLTSSSCPTHPVYMDARLDGPLNIVPDSFYMERSKEYRFASVNFNFGDEMSVSLPLNVMRKNTISCVCQMIRHTSFARSSSLVGTLMAIYLKIGRNEKKTKEYG